MINLSQSNPGLRYLKFRGLIFFTPVLNCLNFVNENTQAISYFYRIKKSLEHFELLAHPGGGLVKH